MKKIAFIFLSLTMLVGVVGCGQAQTNTQEAVVANAENTTGTEQSAQNQEQAEETSKEESQNVASEKDWSNDRVIASSVAVVEILDRLGVPMVGVPTSSYTLPKSVDDATRIGNPMSPDMEVIVSLEPTVIISLESLSEELKGQFETLGIESEFLNLTSYDGLKESLEKLGKYFEVEEVASEVIADFESREGQIEAKLVGKEGPSVLIMFGAGATFMSSTENTYIGDLAKRVGASNVLEGMNGGFVPVDMEFLADKNPQYILFMSHANPQESLAAFRKEFETNEAWQNFDAVKNDKVIALETSYFGMSANLLAIDAMEKLVEYLYE
jgi:iron complex transport system substrate-binding protein